jgi:hypothetical protein
VSILRIARMVDLCLALLLQAHALAQEARQPPD